MSSEHRLETAQPSMPVGCVSRIGPTELEENSGGPCTVLTPGEKLDLGLARDQGSREGRRRSFDRWLARTAALERLGRYACVAAGLICPLAGPQPPDLDWLRPIVYDVLRTLWMAGPVFVLVGMLARRSLLRIARRQAVEPIQSSELNAPDSIVDERIWELKSELEAIRKNADESERVCLGCALFGAVMVAAPRFGIWLEDTSSGMLVLMLLVPFVALVDLVSACSRIAAWWSYRSWLRRLRGVAEITE